MSSSNSTSTATDSNVSLVIEQSQQQQQPQQPKILTEEELKIKEFVESLKLTFPHKWELEYHEFITKGSLNNPVIPLIVISVDRMLTKEERAMIPNTFENRIRIQMEYVMTLDPNDESVQKELQEQQAAGSNGEITMGDDDDEEFEDDDEDDE